MRVQTRHKPYKRALYRAVLGGIAILLPLSGVIGMLGVLNTHAATPAYQWTQDIGHKNFFQGAYQILATNDGGFYITDTIGKGIVRFDSAGTFVSRIDVKEGGTGTDAYVYALATDATGNIYAGASDGTGASVLKYSPSGAFLTKIGAPGNGTGQFDSSILGLTIDSEGSIYVSGRYDARIQKFDVNGNYVTEFIDQGAGNGQLQQRARILATADALYAVDVAMHRVQVFDQNGMYLSQFGSQGSGNGQFNEPSSIALGDDGNLLVVDRGNNRVQTFTPAGVYVGQFPVGPYLGSIAPAPGNTYYAKPDTTNEVQKIDASGAMLSTIAGNGGGSLYNASRLFVGADDAVYVIDSGNKRIQKFDRNGNLARTIPFVGCDYGPEGFNQVFHATVDATGNIYAITNNGPGVTCIKKYNLLGVPIAEFGTDGTGAGQVTPQSVITTDGMSKLYVADGSKYAVDVFDLNGTYLSQFGSQGAGAGQFGNQLYDISYKNGYVYVNDRDNQRILRFSADGTYSSSYNTQGTFEGTFGVAIDSDGTLYTGNRLGGSIIRFAASGATLSSFSTSGTQNLPVSVAIDSHNSLYVLSSNPGVTVSRYDRFIVNAPIEAPSNLAASSIQAHSLDISWDMSGGGADAPTNFNIRVRAVGASMDTSLVNVPAEQRSLTVAGLAASTTYNIYVSGGNIDGFGPEATITVTTADAPPRGIASVAFSEESGRKIMTVTGTDLVGYENPSEYADALSRSLVQLNGVNLPFCTEGIGVTAQELIEAYSASFPNITQLVSDGPNCYYLLRDGFNPTITPTEAIIWLPDDFNTTAQGTVSVNGVPQFTFNAPVDPGVPVTPTVQSDGGKPLTHNPTLSRRPTFSGVAAPGAHITVTVHSDPITCSTVADSNGNWSCKLPADLPSGLHTVFVTVTNPDNSVVELGPYTVTVADTAMPPVLRGSDTPQPRRASSNDQGIAVTTEPHSDTPASTDTPPSKSSSNMPEVTQNEQSKTPKASSTNAWWIWLAALIGAGVVLFIIGTARRKK